MPLAARIRHVLEVGARQARGSGRIRPVRALCRRFASSQTIAYKLARPLCAERKGGR